MQVQSFKASGLRNVVEVGLKRQRAQVLGPTGVRVPVAACRFGVQVLRCIFRVCFGVRGCRNWGIYRIAGTSPTKTAGCSEERDIYIYIIHIHIYIYMYAYTHTQIHKYINDI